MSSQIISFRQATESDAKLVFDWSNDSLVRKQSFNTQPIVWENHVQWFKKKLHSSSDLFLVVLVANVPAGLVRFEGISQKTVIGILIDASLRGKGLAVPILKGAVNEYFSKFRSPIFAYIKKTNSASIKAFERAGFVLANEESVNGTASFVYSIEPKSIG